MGVASSLQEGDSARRPPIPSVKSLQPGSRPPPLLHRPGSDLKLLVRPGRTEPPCQPFDLQPARTRGVVGACPWPGDKARLQSPNAPPPPGALLQETSWVYWITWPPAIGAPGGWTPLPSPAARAGRGLVGAGLCSEPGCTGLTLPQARRPSFSPGISEAEGLQASRLSRGLFLGGHLGFCSS